MLADKEPAASLFSHHPAKEGWGIGWGDGPFLYPRLVRAVHKKALLLKEGFAIYGHFPVL